MTALTEVARHIPEASETIDEAGHRLGVPEPERKLFTQLFGLREFRVAPARGYADRLMDAASKLERLRGNESRVRYVMAARTFRDTAQDVDAPFIHDLPSGWATRLGSPWPAGVDLSGGQWQQLALARARMRMSPLLVLFDQPTAALDPETEHRLFERLVYGAGPHGPEGTLTVVVSHRFSTVALAELIVVLDDGRVAEVGSHAELMAAGRGYATYYGLQTAAYRYEAWR